MRELPVAHLGAAGASGATIVTVASEAGAAVASVVTGTTGQPLPSVARDDGATTTSCLHSRST